MKPYLGVSAETVSVGENNQTRQSGKPDYHGGEACNVAGLAQV